MINKYCATALMFDNNWVNNSVLEDLCGKTMMTTLGMSSNKITLEFYKEDEHLMAILSTKILIPSDVYYLDIGFIAEYDPENGNVLSFSDVLDIVFQPTHANPKVKKIKRWTDG